MTQKPLVPSNVICQVGVIVRDIDRSITEYCRVFGLPRPDVSLTAGYDQSKATFNGQSTEARAKLAFFKMGEQLSVELIEPVGGPSTWQEFLDTKGEGVHHIAFMIKDTPKVTGDLAAAGFPTQQQGHYTGGMYTYVDSAPALGMILELLENF